MTARKRPGHARTALGAMLRRTRAQLEVIGLVSQAETLLSGDVDATARQITELAAGVVGCERVNVWLFNEDETELRCIDLFEASTGRHSAGMILHEEEYGPEFQAIKTARYVNADDPLTDPRTVGYVENYLKPLGITSMLDAVIHASGQNFGLLCFEHVQRPHRWEQDEIRFACQLADKIGLALLSRARRRAEEDACATAAALAEAQALARVGSWELDASGLLTWSDETYSIFGVERDTFVPSFETVLARMHPEDRDGVRARYLHAVRTGTDFTTDHRVVLDDGGVVYVHERARTHFDEAGRFVRSVGTVQDVTERRLFEVAVEARDAVLHAVMLSAAELVSGNTLAETMPRALEVVARAIAVDRVMVVSRRSPLAGPWLEHAWQAPHVSDPAVDVLQRWRQAEVAGWFAPLDRGDAVMTTAREASPELAAMMAAVHSRSLLCVPIVIKGETWACIGVDDCRTERVWSSTELDALGTLARVTGSLVMRETALAELRRSEERFRAVTEAAQDAIILTDAGGVVRYWNRSAERILGYSAEEAVGQSLSGRILGSPALDGQAGGADAFLSEAPGAAGRTMQLMAVRKDGIEVPVELSVATMELGAERHAVGILRDITERKEWEARILEMARVDGLTGLANRRVFAEAIRQAIGRVTRGGMAFAVLYLDLDHFKDVNDTLGHPVGDLLLKAVADRLRASIRSADTVARFGGDEFAVLQTGLRDPEDAAALARNLIEMLGRPYVIGGNELRSGASIGVTVYGPDGRDVESLLSHADIALYRAKSEGRGTCRFFTEAMGSEVRTRVALGAELREALGAGQLFLMYQPQMEVRTGRIVGVEALLRWAHPQRGIVQPGEFIPAAERMGLVVPVGRWVINEACRQAKAWLDEGVAPGLVAVNLSAVQLKAPLELERDISRALDETGLPPERLEIELTETAVMETSREHSDVLRRLRASRVRLALDDFGTGYSSLEYLHRFPVDRIKIAQSFVLGLGAVAGDAAIVKAALGLARELGLSAIAEGVETEGQLRLLREWGCPEVQGYYFSPPLAADGMRELLRAGRVRVLVEGATPVGA
jgi:diguanylate cyclase (GGDEF)-like protein/PAS domain S-box-containing protein